MLQIPWCSNCGSLTGLPVLQSTAYPEAECGVGMWMQLAAISSVSSPSKTNALWRVSLHPREQQPATEAHLHEMGEKVTFLKSRFLGHFSVSQTQWRHVADVSDIEGSMSRVSLVPRRDQNVSRISRERNGRSFDIVCTLLCGGGRVCGLALAKQSGSLSMR